MEECSLEDFIGEIPVDLQGFSYDDYHQFTDFRVGYIMLLALTGSPHEKGDRVPILEKVKELLGPGVASMIPEDGWEPVELHSMLDKTDFEGAAHFADWVHHTTDCMLLDASRDEYDGEGWRRDLVDEFTVQQPRVDKIWASIHGVCEWLEADRHNNFLALLSLLLDRKDLVVPKEQLPLPFDDEVEFAEEEV